MSKPTKKLYFADSEYKDPLIRMKQEQTNVITVKEAFELHTKKMNLFYDVVGSMFSEHYLDLTFGVEFNGSEYGFRVTSRRFPNPNKLIVLTMLHVEMNDYINVGVSLNNKHVELGVYNPQTGVFTKADDFWENMFMAHVRL